MEFLQSTKISGLLRLVEPQAMAWKHIPQPTFFSCTTTLTRHFGHLLRESWRYFMWNCFLQQDRKDSAALRNVPCDSGRIKNCGCCGAQRQCSRSEHLMASLALCGFTKNARSETKPSGCCPFCSFFPGDRQHLFWDCPVRNSNRTEPSDLTEAVLGWPPVGGHSDTLSRLGRVRKEMLDHRYGGATPGGRGGRVSKDLCCFAAVHPR